MVHEGGPSPEMPRDREDDFQVVRVLVHPTHLVQRSHAPRYKSRSALVCSVQNEGSRVGTVPVSVNFGKNEFRHVLPLLKLEKKKKPACVELDLTVQSRCEDPCWGRWLWEMENSSAPSRLVLVLGELTFALGMKILRLSFISFECESLPLGCCSTF